MACTLGHFVIPKRVFLAWMPSINKKCHQNHFLRVLEITGCRLSHLNNLCVQEAPINENSNYVVPQLRKMLTLTKDQCLRVLAFLLILHIVHTTFFIVRDSDLKMLTLAYWSLGECEHRPATRIPHSKPGEYQRMQIKQVWSIPSQYTVLGQCWMVARL